MGGRFKGGGFRFFGVGLGQYQGYISAKTFKIAADG